ncbi:HEAT repeat containing 9 [Desmophyllum pertusum]|uniref:HEAT repeat containing 9 n=1 Tax=Desmophyllum pertusum TaxID=174260 RepID=A0A9W9ZAC9_9CNID|nr:HEAT repeat containing 9 [Desmophyllum pertusum]
MMSTPKARGRSRETKMSDNKPVIGLRPIKERNKRSEAMIEEQVLVMRETQSALQKTLENLEKALTEDDLQKSEEELQQLFNKSEELLVIVQVLMKIRNELAHARLDLERAIKTNSGVDAAKKRVKWLQDRLEKVLLTARSYCHLYNRSLQRSKTPKSGLKDQISEKLWNGLSEGQQGLLLQSEKRNHNQYVTVELNMHIKSVTAENVDAMGESEHPVIVTDTAQENDNAGLLRDKNMSQKSKQRKRSDGSKGDSTKSSSNNLIQLLPTSPQDHHDSDQESDTTAEPQSEPEDFDDRRSDSIASSVGIHELEISESNAKGHVPTVEVAENDGMPNDGDDSPPPTPFKSQTVEQGPEDLTSVSRIGTVKHEDDKVEEYWGSDHHKFEWSGYMQSLDPRSWHALGLGVPESFLSKESRHFDPDLPWKEKPMKVNSVIDVHKIALDKLLLRLHRMYEAISQATQTTIDPALKDEKIETVMGKLELEVEGGSVMEKDQQVIQPSTSKQASHISLPHIGSPVAGQKSTFSIEKYPVVIHEPTAIRTARRNPKKLYPQHSSAWCEDLEGGYRMPRIVKVKPKPKLPRTKSVAQSRYLPRKQESPKNERQVSELDLANKSIWMPSMVMKIVTALKVFSPMEREQSVDHDGPKWSRIETLLGEGGVLSSNSEIAAEAARTIGQLKCRDKCVVDTLTEVIKLQRDPKVCYEASKSNDLVGDMGSICNGSH